MEKTTKDDEIRELEDEIDSAVDRLFADKRGGGTEELLKESPLPEPTFEIGNGLDVEDTFTAAPSLSPPPSVEEGLGAEHPVNPPAASPPLPSPMKLIEKVEAQLLSLEWEITGEKLQKARDEILIAQGLFKERTDVGTVLNLMAKVLGYMIRNEDDIRPPLINFLLDAKETIKLLLKESAEKDIQIYRRLVYGGIDARFNCLEGMKEPQMESSSLLKVEAARATAAPTVGLDKIEEMLNRMNLFSDRAGETLDKIDQRLSSLEKVTQEAARKPAEARSSTMDVTVFEIGGELFGVESEKVCKLYRPPKGFQEKYSDLQNVRLQGFEVRMIDLSKLFTTQKEDRKGEIKILVVKDNGEYKGLKIGRVLKRLSTLPDLKGEGGEHFLGRIHWTYQEGLVEIPILNLKSL